LRAERSEAKQSRGNTGGLDRFVASLLAMTPYFIVIASEAKQARVRTRALDRFVAALHAMTLCFIVIASSTR
jgi:hypothetical protein